MRVFNDNTDSLARAKGEHLWNWDGRVFRDLSPHCLQLVRQEYAVSRFIGGTLNTVLRNDCQQLCQRPNTPPSARDHRQAKVQIIIDTAGA